MNRKSISFSGRRRHTWGVVGKLSVFLWHSCYLLILLRCSIGYDSIERRAIFPYSAWRSVVLNLSVGALQNNTHKSQEGLNSFPILSDDADLCSDVVLV